MKEDKVQRRKKVRSNMAGPDNVRAAKPQEE